MVGAPWGATTAARVLVQIRVRKIGLFAMPEPAPAREETCMVGGVTREACRQGQTERWKQPPKSR